MYWNNRKRYEKYFQYLYNKTITDESYEILKSYLKNDYMIIDQMYEYGWIDDEQYQLLK